MRWVLGLVLVIGCGPLSAPPPVRDPAVPRAPRKIPADFYIARAPRPDIDVSAYLPDFHDELRWPLSGMSHPVLEPRFPVASELAIGVDWRELCARGVHLRTSATQQDLRRYLHAWCDVHARNIGAAVARFRPLLATVTRGLAAAVRHDLANVLAAAGGDEAEHWLSRHDVRDIETLDLLAATLAEVGTHADAGTINRRAIDADRQPSVSTRCRRLVKHIVLATNTDPVAAVEELQSLARASKLADPICVAGYEKIACRRDPRNACKRYHKAHGMPLATSLLALYYGWPVKGDMFVWARASSYALDALPLEGAAELLVTAYEASMRADDSCNAERAARIQRAIEQLRHHRAEASYEARLQPMLDRCSRPTSPAFPRAPDASILGP